MDCMSFLHLCEALCVVVYMWFYVCVNGLGVVMFLKMCV